jgi:hypothetical protein
MFERFIIKVAGTERNPGGTLYITEFANDCKLILTNLPGGVPTPDGQRCGAAILYYDLATAGGDIEEWYKRVQEDGFDATHEILSVVPLSVALRDLKTK